MDLFDSKFFADILRDGILVNDDVHGFVFHERFGCVEVSTEFVILVPRVFHDIVNRTVLVFGLTDHVHAVVIGGLEVVERRLTHLLRDRALLAGLVEGVWFPLGIASHLAISAPLISFVSVVGTTATPGCEVWKPLSLTSEAQAKV